MQTYGKFFNRPKREKRIVDKWSIDITRVIYLTIFSSVYIILVLFSATGGLRGKVLEAFEKTISAGCFSACLIFTT